VETAGATVTSTQRNAIDAFFKTGKSQGWISSLRRVYLPIWAAAAPNAIDMMTVTSGTFVGGITHQAGFVEGDGATGYFNTNTNLLSNGLTPSSGYFSVLSLNDQTASGGCFYGSGSGSNSLVLRENPIGSTQYMYSNFTGIGTASVVSSRIGILSFSRFGGDRCLARRSSSGRTESSRITGANSGNITGADFIMLARNNSDTSNFFPASYSNSQIGGFAFGLGFSANEDASFTMALKTLWETSTGLPLP
jgi:hypothetical protein